MKVMPINEGHRMGFVVIPSGLGSDVSCYQNKPLAVQMMSLLDTIYSEKYFDPSV